MGPELHRHLIYSLGNLEHLEMYSPNATQINLSNNAHKLGYTRLTDTKVGMVVRNLPNLNELDLRTPLKHEDGNDLTWNSAQFIVQLQQLTSLNIRTLPSSS